MKSFADYRIEISPSDTGPEVYKLCPECSHLRAKNRVKCLSVNVEKGVWCCQHCGWVGGLGGGDTSRAPEHRPQYRKPAALIQTILPKLALDWFHARGITDAVLARNRIESRRVYMPQIEDFVEAAIFPYFRNGELINLKYRAIPEKHFRLEPQCEVIFYGLDDAHPDQPLIWVEGEMDKLALEVAGFKNVASVPNGAPAPESKNYSALLKFLDADWEKIQSVKHHVLAVDADVPGIHLEGELSRRLGVEKCSRVRWPEGIKDANEMLLKHGAIDLCWYIENAEAFPIQGTFTVSDCRDEILELYEHGFENGKSTGWQKLDELYRVRPGEFTAITGIPSSGKSNFLDALLVNLARLHHWGFALFSPENLPIEQHVAAIVEKYKDKPFHAGPTTRMTRDELEQATAWVNEHFTWILPTSGDDWTVEKILATASQLCLRRGIRGLVIDPWNELESLRPERMTETEYISQSLRRIRAFTQQHRVHVWVVIHPAKMYRDKAGKYPVPTLYDCSGSAHWRNKCDNGIVVWRDLSQADSDEVQIHVQKIRFRQAGHRGMTTLKYNPVCATYSDAKLTNGHDTDRGARNFTDKEEGWESVSHTS